MNYALIFAGGTGERMRSKDIPKQLLKVHDKEIIVHTLEHFQNHSEIAGIVLVFNEKYIEKAKKLIVDYKISKIISIVSGGKNGQESIYNGLLEIDKIAKKDDIVLIHDGVRPLITEELITENIKLTKLKGSSISSTSAIETILLANSQNSIVQIIDRNMAKYGRAPQTFLFNDIFQAHKNAIRDQKLDFIDSASIMNHYGHSLHFCECSTDNIKITTIKDYYIFKAILDAREMSQFSLEDNSNEKK